MDAVELAARHGQVARHARARRNHHRVVGGPELVAADVHPDVDAVAHLDALGEQLVEAPFDEPLLDLELGHAEPHEATRRLVTLEHGDGVPRSGELLRAGETRRARPDDRDGAAAQLRRRPGHDPALVPGPIDDRELDLLDRDGVALADLEHASRLAGRRAEPARELREVVRAVELIDRLAPAVAVDEVVPVRNQVAERAAVVAERDTALHAAGALATELEQRQRPHELAHIQHALGRLALECLRARNLEEGAELAHQPFSSVSAVKKPPPPVETGWSSRSMSRSASARL